MGDVLILGGGLAGTATALFLADRGIGSTIVEARPRLGGRALSVRLADGTGPAADLGGSWAHAGQGQVQALAARLGIALVPRPPLSARRFLRDGGVHDTPCHPHEADAHDAAMRRWQADAAAGDPALLGLTLADYLDRRAVPPSARREIMAWWSISGAAAPDAARLGQLMGPKLARGWGPKLDELGFTFAGGAQTLAEGAARASGAGIVLSDPARRLTAGPDGVRLRLASGRDLGAGAAVVALPVNALSQIAFDPPLPPGPARVRATGHAGRAVKLVIRARGVAPGQLVTGQAHGLRFLWADHLRPDGSTLIVAFALAGDLPDPGGDGVRMAVAQAFPGGDVLSADWHDWLSDPFAAGTWVTPPAQDEPLYDPAGWGPFGRVAFAGSDIAPGADQGWFEGAVISAGRAAAAIATLPGMPPHQSDRLTRHVPPARPVAPLSPAS